SEANNLGELHDKLFKIVLEKHLEKIVLITKQKDNELAILLKDKISENQELKFEECEDKVSFDDFTSESQDKVLEQKVIFQGDEISLSKLMSKEDLKKVIDERDLHDLVERKRIQIGEALPDFGMVKCYYIDRKFNRRVKIKEEVLAEEQG